MRHYSPSQIRHFHSAVAQVLNAVEPFHHRAHESYAQAAGWWARENEAPVTDFEVSNHPDIDAINLKMDGREG